jgi:hypothetical protein
MRKINVLKLRNQGFVFQREDPMGISKSLKNGVGEILDNLSLKSVSAY